MKNMELTINTAYILIDALSISETVLTEEIAKQDRSYLVRGCDCGAEAKADLISRLEKFREQKKQLTYYVEIERTRIA
jgi:hypothetical protein